MKALTIQQPWATLIALGEKRFETRSRKTNIRGPIAIHAGKKIDKAACQREPIKSTLAKHGYTADNLPTGAVIAIAELTYSWFIIIDLNTYLPSLLSGSGEILQYVNSNESAFGWYEDGRHAWELSNVKAIEPIPAKRQQGWWNWEETYTVEQASQKAFEWCQANKGWKRICDIDDSDSLYKSWNELPKKIKNYWINEYGEYSAESAWKEFGEAYCKVPKGFISGKGEFYEDVLEVPRFHNLMTVFKVS